jgi:ABC-2 type transport system ATP-binding protein
MIDVQHLTKRFGGTVAVDDATFVVRPGHVTAFVGPNGAGKSTTMRMILGLDAPTAGRVLVAGRRYEELRVPLRVIGALLEASAVDDGRTAANHLLWLARSNRLDARRIDTVLDLVGLGSVAGRRVGTFSLGMRQRLGLAAALLGDPAVLMLDEPTNGLDPDGIHWLRDILRRLAAEGRTVFLSSHLMSEVAQTADHVVVIGRGRVIADEPIDSIVSRHGMQLVYVRADRVDDLSLHLVRHGGTIEPAEPGALVVQGLASEAIGAIAVAEGIALTELTPRHPSLEDAFLELTHDVSLLATGAGAQNGD